MTKKLYNGIITKAVGGYYDVVTSDGVICCTARGIFRKNKISPCAGDNVTVEIEQSAQPVITEIAERKNHLIRPPLANLDCALIVTSAVDPPPNAFVTDKLTAIFEGKGIEPIIVITKNDIQGCEEFAEIYRGCGFKVIYSDESGRGSDEILSAIGGKLSALIGNSGVGKSSLMNRIFPNLDINTAQISKKLGRGRHTTRQVELYALPDGGYIADTPGFSTVEVSRYGYVDKSELQYTFREFESYLEHCRYRDCVHLKETGCAVTEAVEQGKINRSRYDSYVRMYEEAKKLNEWEFK
ncbi:MAG: ribosome small subunit-dependent GTPase A [Eubacterium sp.]|nr:ribosome small subunit-dependent GTPase A [Eubacterium sp.]